MKFRHLLFLLVSVIVWAFLTSVNVSAQSSKDFKAKAEKETREVYQRLLDGSRLKDEKILREVLTNDYSQILNSGRIRTKEQRINEALQGKGKITTLAIDDFRLRTYSNAAVALCKVRDEGVDADGKPYKLLILSTATFVKQNGKWRIAATHLSLLNNSTSETQ